MAECQLRLWMLWTEIGHTPTKSTYQSATLRRCGDVRDDPSTFFYISLSLHTQEKSNPTDRDCGGASDRL